MGWTFSSRAGAIPSGSDAKIAPQVWADLAGGENASVVILLTDQADVSAAYQMNDQDARGWFVYNTLTRHAARTQSGVRRFLGRRYRMWITDQVRKGTRAKTIADTSIVAKRGSVRDRNRRPTLDCGDARNLPSTQRRVRKARAPEERQIVDVAGY